MNRRLRWCAVAALAVLAAVAPARAQLRDTAVIGSRDVVRKLEQRRDQRASEEFFRDAGTARGGTEYGGWSTVTWLDIDELDHNGAALDPVSDVFVLDTRAWVKHTINARKNVFIRFRKLDLDIDTAPGVVPLDVRTKEQFDLDIAHFEFPVGQTQVRLGRLFTRVGRGLTLSDTLDGARFDYRSSRGVTFSGFVGSTLHRSDNVDTNVSGFDQGHNDRTFVGTAATYTTLGNHRVTGYAVDQNDNTPSANPLQDLTTFRYDSYYLGLGAEGPLGDRTSYAAELVRQRGTSGTLNGGASREQVEAFAALLSVFHRLPGTSLPTLTFDYAFGSGDPNRLSVTDTGVAGPLIGQSDHNFLYFGRFEGGLALQPRLSNLEVVRLGMQLKPLEGRLAAPTDLLVGFKLSGYSKDTLGGAISDPLATVAQRRVGYGADVFTAWKVFSDVDVLLEYGAFKPGNAYPEGFRDETHKVAGTATFAF
jgi:hypothetical protein